MAQQTEFIPYEEAIELKELGYDIDSVSGYSYPDSDKLLTQAILYQQAFRWFREKYKFDLTIQHNKKYVAIVYSSVINFSIDEYETYEEAELACLKKLIEIVKNK
jgi:hypothetical protein